MEGVWRQHNEVSSGASDPAFSTLPFHNSPLYFEDETRFSAQQSRLAIKATGDIDPAQHLTAYWENDWLGAAPTANSRESNSYNLRMRQAWLFYDNDNWHSHFLAGQAWSMLTANRPRNSARHRECAAVDRRAVCRRLQLGAAAAIAVRPGLEQNGLVRRLGRSHHRRPLHRTGTASPAPPHSAPAMARSCPPVSASTLGITATRADCSTTSLSARPTCTLTVIEKLAVDPGWGHFEAVGLQRWFTDDVASIGFPFLPHGVAVSPAGKQETHFGWGVGGSVFTAVLGKSARPAGQRSDRPRFGPLWLEPIGRCHHRTGRDAKAADAPHRFCSGWSLILGRASTSMAMLARSR